MYLHKYLDLIKNILVTNPTKNDFLKLKSEIEKLEEFIKENKIKIIDLTKNIEGTENEDEYAEFLIPEEKISEFWNLNSAFVETFRKTFAT